MGDDPERFLRPEATVLGEQSLVPRENQIRPPPNCFTHRLAKDEPFYFARETPRDAPDGRLPAGTKVLLVRRHEDARCRVADARGLYVEVDCAALARLA